jgi:uncharacterized protein (TIGR00730 family)
MRVCVFCGSRPGDPAHLAAARELGASLARRRVGLVYGGASVGLMGALADAALTGGGEVIGVMPRGLFSREIAHRGLSTFYETDSLHVRKQKMHELSDAFIAIPGGFGTLDELFEAVTWKQVGIHQKPIGLLNLDGYFDGLLAFEARARTSGLVAAESPWLVEPTVTRLLDGLLR